MRKANSAEQAFVTGLVRNVTVLVKNRNLSLRLKIASLQKAALENAEHVTALRGAMRNAADEEVAKRLKKWIAIREEATAYLVNTAKWLIHVERCPNTLNQRPRIFAVPSWDRNEMPATVSPSTS